MARDLHPFSLSYSPIFQFFQITLAYSRPNNNNSSNKNIRNNNKGHKSKTKIKKAHFKNLDKALHIEYINTRDTVEGKDAGRDRNGERE